MKDYKDFSGEKKSKPNQPNKKKIHKGKLIAIPKL